MPNDDFIAQASRLLTSSRQLPPLSDGVSLLKQAAEAVAEVNRESAVPVTVSDYAILVLADVLAKTRRLPVP